MERLQRILSARGVASRRAAEDLISAGRVMVNGVVVTELGTKADAERAEIKVDGKSLKIQKPRYIILNKPSGFITTTKDERNRYTVMQLVDVPERVYPVGRLDRDTEGLLLFTNDGDLANRVMHPRYALDKEYHVLTFAKPSTATLQRVNDGVTVEGRRIVPREFRILRETHEGLVLTVTVHEGMYHLVHLMMDMVGIKVERLRRVRVGPLSIAGIDRGGWRDLTPGEVSTLTEALHLDREQAETRRPAAGKSHRRPATLTRPAVSAASAALVRDRQPQQFGSGQAQTERGAAEDGRQPMAPAPYRHDDRTRQRQPPRQDRATAAGGPPEGGHARDQQGVGAAPPSIEQNRDRSAPTGRRGRGEKNAERRREPDAFKRITSAFASFGDDREESAPEERTRHGRNAATGKKHRHAGGRNGQQAIAERASKRQSSPAQDVRKPGSTKSGNLRFASPPGGGDERAAPVRLSADQQRRMGRKVKSDGPTGKFSPRAPGPGSTSEAGGDRRGPGGRPADRRDRPKDGGRPTGGRSEPGGRSAPRSTDGAPRRPAPTAPRSGGTGGRERGFDKRGSGPVDNARRSASGDRDRRPGRGGKNDRGEAIGDKDRRDLP